jgi:hypothetical protein
MKNNKTMTSSGKCLRTTSFAVLFSALALMAAVATSTKLLCENH